MLAVHHPSHAALHGPNVSGKRHSVLRRGNAAHLPVHILHFYVLCRVLLWGAVHVLWEPRRILRVGHEVARRVPRLLELRLGRSVYPLGEILSVLLETGLNSEVLSHKMVW